LIEGFIILLSGASIAVTFSVGFSELKSKGICGFILSKLWFSTAILCMLQLFIFAGTGIPLQGEGMPGNVALIGCWMILSFGFSFIIDILYYKE